MSADERLCIGGRDLVGDGAHPPHAHWPGGARIALQFVLNYEEGGERSVLYGDGESESYLHEVVGGSPVVGRRAPNVESVYEYGSRAGFWRIHRLFTEAGVPLTIYGVTQALEQADIPVLWNAIATPFGDDFPVVGFADYWSKEFDPSVLGQLDPAVPRLVLSHNPDTAEPLAQWRVDLQLSGHTHGGQVYVPFCGPGPLVWQRIRRGVPSAIRNRIPFLSDRCFHVVRHWEWCRGLHQVGDNWLYVNRGLGTYFPGRFMCSPELTVFTLVRA